MYDSSDSMSGNCLGTFDFSTFSDSLLEEIHAIIRFDEVSARFALVQTVSYASKAVSAA